jgi:hypothetical protein
MQTSVPQRDATGKFVPQAAEKWLKRSQEKADAHQQRLDRLQTTYGEWAQTMGLTLQDLDAIFA